MIQQKNVIKITLSQLFSYGVHIGYLKKFLSGQVQPYLFGKKNNFVFFNIKYAYSQWKLVLHIIFNLISLRQKILIVNHFHEVIDLSVFLTVKRCYILNGHWRGGFLTNYKVIRLYTNYSNQDQYQLWSLTQLPSFAVFLNTTVTNESIRESLHLNIPTAVVTGSTYNLINHSLYNIIGNNQSTVALTFYANLIRLTVLKGFIKEKAKILQLL